MIDRVEPQEENRPLPKRRFFSIWNSHWPFASLTALILLVLISLQKLRTSIHSSGGLGLVSHDCGTTPAEALAKGCIFDRMNYGWTPPACLDTELEDSVYKESMKKGPVWKWWLDGNFTQEVPQDWEELSKLPHIYTEHRYHVVHCVYTWKVLHRAAMKQDSLVYAFIGNYGHTTHCSALLEDAATNPADAPAHMNVKMVFAGCMVLADA